jgi:integrase
VNTHSYRPVEEAASAYLASLNRRQKAPLTITRYRAYLGAFARWAGERAIDSITAQDIEMDYLASWHSAFQERNSHQPSANTMRNHLQALRSFFTWLATYDYLTGRNPMTRIETVKVRSRRRDWLSPEQLQALIDACEKPQHRFLVMWLAFTGMRISEANSLRKSNIDFAQSNISIPASKTESGIRTIPIMPELLPEIRKWTADLGPTDIVLRTRSGKGMTEQQAFTTLGRLGKQVGIDKVTPHTLRRTFGSQLINAGVRLETVSKLLGHSNTTTTEKAYAELLDATIAAEVLKAVS